MFTLDCLCYRTTLRFDVLHSFMLYLLFRHIGKLVTNQQNVIYVFAARVVDNPEIKVVRISNHKRVKEIET